MSSKPRKITKPTLIDPLFQIPLGMEDEFVFSRDINDTVYRESDTRKGGRGFEYDTPFGSFDSTIQTGQAPGQFPLATPNNLVIFDQKIRKANGGTVVVDVVAQFDTVPGAERYEIRVTKI